MRGKRKLGRARRDWGQRHVFEETDPIACECNHPRLAAVWHRPFCPVRQGSMARRPE